MARATASKKTKKTKKTGTAKRTAKKLPKRSKKKKKVSKKKTKKKLTKKASKKATKKKTSKKKKKSKVSRKKTATKSKKKAKKKVAKKKTTRKTAKKSKASKSKSKVVAIKTARRAASPKKTETKTYKLNVGDMAPDFNIRDQHGNMTSLSQFRGKKVVLYFYPKDDTPGCTREACSFRDHLAQFEGQNAAIVGLSFDDQSSHEKFIEKYSLNFTLLSDTEKEVANEYGVYVEKNMYGKTYMGIERSTFIISTEGRLSEVFRRVKVDGHTEAVLKALEAAS